MLKRLRPELPDGCVSDLSFDSLRAGELSTAAEQQIADHVTRCGRCRDRQRTLARTHTQVEKQLPVFVPRPAAPQQQTPLPTVARLPWARRNGKALSALALAACGLLGLLPWAARERAGELDTRTKGGPGLSFYVKRGEEVFTWAPGDAVTAGDALRFVVRPRGYTEVAVLSREEDGETSLYYPRGEHSAAIDGAAASIALDGAVELDDTMRDERLFAVFCRARFATNALRSELAASGGLLPPPDCAVASLELQKRRKP